MKRSSLFLLAYLAFTGYACSLFTPVKQSEPTPPKATQTEVVLEPTPTSAPTERPVPALSFGLACHVSVGPEWTAGWKASN